VNEKENKDICSKWKIGGKGPKSKQKASYHSTPSPSIRSRRPGANSLHHSNKTKRNKKTNKSKRTLNNNSAQNIIKEKSE
jgi:hypothetical protein